LEALIIGPILNPSAVSGEFNTALNWAKAVYLVGAHVKVLCLGSMCSGYYRIDGLNIEYISMKQRTATLRDFFKLQKEIVERIRDFNVVHFAMDADSVSFTPMLSLLKLAGRKIINSYLLRNPPLEIYTFFNKIVLFDLLTVTSKRLSHLFVQKYRNRAKIEVIPPCIDTNFFKPRDKFVIREKLNLPQDCFLMFTLGHFRSGRRISSLIKIVDELREEHRNIMLMVGWTGYGDANNINEIFSLSKQKRFTKIIPPTSNINLYYDAADVYVLTAKSDSVIEVPISIIEALSSGTPVIAFYVNAVSEIVKDGFNGYLIEDGNFREMKLKIASLIDDPNLLKYFSVNARRVALNNFSYEVIGRKLYDTYKRVVTY
jgi:glycosyltransferase involved in cell wall biosynthesis